MQIMMTKKVPANVKTLAISAKVSDLFNCTVLDGNEQMIAEYDGYVPSFFPDKGGDYLFLIIDVDTGQITNWKAPTQRQMEDFIGGCEMANAD